MENKYKALIIVVAILVIGLLFYKLHPISKDECYRLGSNERMQACLAEVERRNPTPTTQPIYLPDSELGLIILHGGSMTGNTYYNPNPIYTATLENKTGKIIHDVIVKFTFYPLGKSCSDLASDTQYVNVASSVLPNDSIGIKTTITTPFNTSGRFTWCSLVVAAKVDN